MDIPADHPVLFALMDKDCSLCHGMEKVLAEVAGANQKTGLEIVAKDLWDEPEAIVALDALAHPTLVLVIRGQEALRVAGHVTKRQLLRKMLPALHHDPDVALQELRTQLGNPGEVFHPRRRGLWTQSSGSKTAILRDVPLFADLTRRQLGQIARHADETTAHAGQTLTTEGDIGDTFYLVTAGSASVEKAGQPIASLEAGDFFGEMALLEDEQRSATVTMREESELLVIHRTDFERLLDEIPGLAKHLLREVSRRLREANERATQ